MPTPRFKDRTVGWDSAGLSATSRRDRGKEGGESLWPECEGGRLGQDQESSVFTEGRTRGLVQAGRLGVIMPHIGAVKAAAISIVVRSRFRLR
jgi:hypothetical protein